VLVILRRLSGAAPAIVAAVLAVLWPVADASGAVVAKDAGTLEISYTGSDAFDSFLLERDTAFVFRRGSMGAGITAGTGCSNGAVFGDSASCPDSPVPVRIVIHTFGGNDYLGVYPQLATSALTIAYGGEGDDILSGGGDNPQELHGGGGNDDLYPIQGVQTSFGEAGDDDFALLSNGDDISGGDGVDTFDGTFYASLDQAVQVSLDGVANDGPIGSPGIRANVGTDIENLRALDGNDVLTGNTAANRLEGGKGDDLLDGGPGPDTLVGDEGDDEIRARDGTADTIECGTGTDHVVADAGDVLGSGCDRVELPPPVPVEPTPEPVPASAPPATPGTTLARVRAPVSSTFALYRRYTKVRKLMVRRLPAAARVQVRCGGRGCPFAKRRATIRRGEARLTGLFGGRRLRPGAVIEVRIAVPQAIGKVVRFVMRRRKLPASTTLCLPPTARRPIRCATA
jgi:hypothetical protein